MISFENLGVYSYILMFAIGLLSGVALYLAWRYARLLEVRSEANAILMEAKEVAAKAKQESEERLKSFSTQIKKRTEKDIRRSQQNAERLQKKIEARESRFQEKFQDREKQANEQMGMVDSYQARVRKIEETYESLKSKKADAKDSYVKALIEKSGTDGSEIKSELAETLIKERERDMEKMMQTSEAEVHADAERQARKLLDRVLNRFVRPFCGERGIGYLNFTTKEQKIRVLGEEEVNLRIVEKLCGVDLVHDKENNSVNVYGFDPVRRELGRATIERMMNERGRYDESRIKGIVEKNKKNLFRKMLQDGNAIAKELCVDGLHQETKNMMGALRYRYSFTQNQYFHCGEVGFLAGLLASELGHDTKEGRRIGLLHDIGKAMDHTQEGGHAVIGADFIEKHGEAKDVVHSVRAHHFDVQPERDLDYLLIAADAISGARPGARRSTASTYTQKIQDLQAIAGKFRGVTDTHIVSAGREVRVYVDGHKVDDHEALEISEGIAEKIESEMAYPGQIKVTVVRSTSAVEYAR